MEFQEEYRLMKELEQERQAIIHSETLERIADRTWIAEITDIFSGYRYACLLRFAFLPKLRTLYCEEFLSLSDGELERIAQWISERKK